MSMKLSITKKPILNPKHVIGLLMLVVLAISISENFINQGGKAWKEVIASDGRGYYAYLPSVFVYHEIGFDSVVVREREVYPSVQASNFLVEINGRFVNKYFIGVALMMAPFFITGTIISIITGIPPDGYNGSYQFMASLSALFYLFLGLVFLWKILNLYRFSDRIINIVLLLILFATNLLIYTVAAPAMSHVYSFSVIAGFIYFSALYFQKQVRGHVFLAIVFISLVILIRPVNALVLLLLPALAHSFRDLINCVRSFFRSGWSYVYPCGGMRKRVISCFGVTKGRVFILLIHDSSMFFLVFKKVFLFTPLLVCWL